MLEDEDFIQSFVEEARVHVETVETELLQLNINQVNDETINNIFRAVHSIKGTSGFLDLPNIVKLSHSMENIFGEIRSGKMHINEGMIDILLAANDCMKTMVEDVKNSDAVEISEHLDKLSTILSGKFLEKEGIKEPDEASPDTLKSIFAVTDSKMQKIQEGILHGHKIFRIKKSLEKTLFQKDRKLVRFIQQIGSVGTVIDCSLDFEGIISLDETNEEVIIELLFMSVLEKDLLSMALDLPEEAICELQDLDGEGKSVEIEKEATTEQVIVDNTTVVAQEPYEKEIHINKGQTIIPEDSIRVNVMLLNDLLNLSSEMVLAKNQLLRSIESHRKSIPGIEPVFQNINHITTNLQEKIMQTRMQPIANVFNKFPRIIREMSKKLGKDIHLEMEGVEVELDKSLIEALGDPMTHLIRNAVDHGLEMPDDREKLGKGREGSVLLKAYHEGGYVNIDVIDDGKGIDIEYLKEKALSKGFVDKADLVTMGEQDILKLIFKPGFSTAEIVTDISGRGVGMDVVKTNIEKLGGTIEIFTALHVGTTFRLLLPLTLAIIPSLIVSSENQKFALPQVNLQEIVRIKANDPARRIELINNAEVLRLRDKLLPIVHLSEVLGLERTFIDQNTGERVKEKRKNLFHSRRVQVTEPRENDLRKTDDRRQFNSMNVVRILVIKIGSRRLGLAVDAIYGIEEILVKTLPVYVKECKCYSGVTILGDGKTSMILDPSGIIEKANLHFFEGLEERKPEDLILENEKMWETQNLLLFQCSGPETLGINMSMVSRVEEIKAENIEKIGDKEYIQFRGEPLRVIRPEDFMPITNQRNLSSKYYVLIPKLVSHPMGILVEKILDTVQVGIHIKQDDNMAMKGLIGSTIINKTIVLLVNIYELFEIANPEYYKVETTMKKGVRMSILLVEDTPFFQKVEKSYLEDAGYNVHLAQNGKEAMEFLENEKVDAVVSDIVMPIMNGLELVRKIRATPHICHLPVIAITSLTGETQINEGIKAGFDAYEFKLDRQKLLEILEKAIRERGVVV